MAVTNPETWSKGWRTGITSQKAQDKMKAGVDAVTVAPGEKAAANVDGYIQGVQQSASKWAKRVAAVPLSEWKNSMKTHGINAIATGAAKGEAKVGKWASYAAPLMQSAVDNLPPRTPDMETNVMQRCLGMCRDMRTIGDNYK
jgi:hypothetical protein